MLQTDASAVGLGAVLEQEGYVVAYASRSLTITERQYSVIQRECLAVVYVLKQFCHYLLGRPFCLLTDHAPLQWLSAQKMEGMLCRWASALQVYEFQIVYRQGSLNANADTLSRLDTTPCAKLLHVILLTNFEQLNRKIELYLKCLRQSLTTSIDLMGMSGVDIPYEGTANFGRNSVLMMALFIDNICQDQH